MEINSPYNTLVASFSPRTLAQTGSQEKSIRIYFDREIQNISPANTFHEKIKKLADANNVKINYWEILENIYPRKDMVGRAEIRNKPNYEEEKGIFNVSELTWSQNSYNNNSAKIRSFWKDNINNRKKTRGVDTEIGLGSINCLDIFNSSSSKQQIKLQQALKDTPYPNFPRYNYYILNDGGEKQYTCFDLTYNNNLNNSMLGIENKTNFDLSFSSSQVLTVDDAFYEAGIDDIDYGIISYNSNTDILGDLAVYSNGELIKFILNDANTGLTPTAKPQFVYNAFLGAELENDMYGQYDFGFNESYARGISGDLQPAYNSYEEFLKNIKHKTQNYSNIPEFIVSYNENTIFGKTIENYLYMNGKEKNNQSNNMESDYIVDFNNFSEGNKIKIKINGIKKLLPYNNFYPSQKSLDICKDFSEAYFVSASLDNYHKQTLLQPFFAPGILFNTIKAGISMPTYVCLTGSDKTINTSSLYETLYDGSEDEHPERNFFIKDSILNTKLPFETVLEPEKYLFNSSNLSNKLVYLDPNRYHSLLTSQSSSYLKFPSANISEITEKAVKQNTENIKKYKLNINNYLAEIPNFFLKGKLTSFISNNEDSFLPMNSGVTYSLNITINQNKNFSMFKNIDLNFEAFDSGLVPNFLYIPDIYSSLFGPSSYFDSYFAPNFLFNEYKATLQFKSSETRKYSLNEILSGTYIFTSSYGSSQGLNISDYMNINQFIQDRDITFDAGTGEPLQIIKNTNKKWVIQPKFEAPLINYYNQITKNSVTTGTLVLSASSGFSGFLIQTHVVHTDGIWNSLGEIPKNNQSIVIGLNDDGITNSLLNVVGFKRENKGIGEFPENKIISEAVVLLPFVIEPKQNLEKYFYSGTEDKHLLKIPEKVINNLLNLRDYKKLGIEQIKIILETNKNLDRNNSIVDLMIKMVNYNLPNHLNWLLNKNIPPVVIYIGEFEHILSTQDLANIWQGTLPTIGTEPEESSISIEHFFEENELINDRNILNLLKAKVFKIKKRANQNYFALTADISDDKNYNFSPNTTDIPWYSYNWPYDYFSLVELVNIQAGEVYDSNISGSS